MKTIQMTIDEVLLQQVDETVQNLHTTRSAFIREALEKALLSYKIRRLEERDAAGYTAVPSQLHETTEWLDNQRWGDEWRVENRIEQHTQHR